MTPEARWRWLSSTLRRQWADRNQTPESAKRRKRRPPEPRMLSLEEMDA